MCGAADQLFCSQPCCGCLVQTSVFVVVLCRPIICEQHWCRSPFTVCFCSCGAQPALLILPCLRRNSFLAHSCNCISDGAEFRQQTSNACVSLCLLLAPDFFESHTQWSLLLRFIITWQELLKVPQKTPLRVLVPSKARSRRDSIVGLNESSVGL